MTFISDIPGSFADRQWHEKAIERATGEIATQRERLILWLPVFLALGIGVYFSLQFEPPLFLGPGTLAISGAVWGLLWPLRETRYLVWLAVAGFFLTTLGYTAAQVRTHFVAAPLLEKEMDPVGVQGRVIVIDKLEEGEGTRLVLDQLTIEDLVQSKTPKKVRLKVRQVPDVKIGDRVEVLAGLKPPSAPVAPGAFDFQRYAFFRQVGAFGFTYREPELTEAGKPDALMETLEQMRETIRHKVDSGLSPPLAAVATALLTGERTGIAEDDWEALRASGLAHMLAISGLHVGLIASVIFMAVRFGMAAFPSFALRHPIKKYAAVLSLTGAVAYMLIVGSTIPTIRAAIMTGIVLFAIMIDRVPFSLRLVAVAAFAVLLLLPESLFGASFQMSFAAVAALIFFYEVTREHWSKWHRHAGFVRRLLLYFVGVCATTVIASLATAPFALFHFQQLAVYSIIANLFAVPLMAFVVMPAAVVSYVLMPFGLEDIGLNVMDAGIAGILSIAHSVEELPLSTFTPPALPLSGLVLFIGAALFAILWRGRGRLLALVPLVFSVVVIAQHSQPDILVSSSGKLVALRDHQGQMWVSSRRYERFTAEVWARRNGQLPEDLGVWRDHDGISCGEYGCRALWNGQRVAYSTHTAGQSEDCAWADVMISKEPIRAKPCNARTVIGFFNLWRDGSYAVWPDGTARNVEMVRGNRPWTVSNRR